MIDEIDILVVLIKAHAVMFAALGMAATITWVERKGSALIQNRIGANRASILGLDLWGIWNTFVADPVKALTKEDFLPKGTSQFMHCLAPFLGVFPVVLSFAVIPFGPAFQVGEREITLQLADLNAGVLYVFAMGSLAVYGTVLAGWVSSNKFSMFGSLRASAQMISYEITMGLSIVGMLAMYGTLDLNEIVAQQSGTVLGVIPAWGVFMLPTNFIAFILFFTSMMAETKRNPFDLPESESELVAGYMTEYSGMKFLLFWLGEFAEIAVASAMVTVIFLGGWQLPWFDLSGLLLSDAGLSFSLFGLNVGNFPLGSLLGAAVFGGKVFILSVLQVTIRWTVPRFRYDQVMDLCWKYMLPLCLINLLVTAVFVLVLG